VRARLLAGGVHVDGGRVVELFAPIKLLLAGWVFLWVLMFVLGGIEAIRQNVASGLLLLLLLLLLMVVLLIGWPAVALLAWLRCRFVAAAASTVVVGHRGGPARTVAGPVSAVVSTHAGFRDLPSGTCVAGVGGQDAPRPNVPASYGLTSTTATLLVGAMVAAGAADPHHSSVTRTGRRKLVRLWPPAILAARWADSVIQRRRDEALRRLEERNIHLDPTGVHDVD